MNYRIVVAGIKKWQKLQVIIQYSPQ